MEETLEVFEPLPSGAQLVVQPGASMRFAALAEFESYAYDLGVLHHVVDGSRQRLVYQHPYDKKWYLLPESGVKLGRAAKAKGAESSEGRIGLRYPPHVLPRDSVTITTANGLVIVRNCTPVPGRDNGQDISGQLQGDKGSKTVWVCLDPRNGASATFTKIYAGLVGMNLDTDCGGDEVWPILKPVCWTRFLYPNDVRGCTPILPCPF